MKPRWLGTTFLAVLLAVGLAPGSVQAAPMLFGITFANELITINTVTGAGTLVGPLSSPMAAFGLGARGGNLYTFDQTADRIRQLDPNTGATVATIDIGIGDIVGEGGITFRSDGIGFLSSSAGGTGRLFSFNIDLGTSTPITPPGGLNPSMDGLDFDAGDTLFGISQDTSALFTINQVTGATTLRGDTGFDDNNTLSGLAFRSDGVLFGEVTNNLIIINPVTGVATIVGPIGFNLLSGLTFLDVQRVPEPATLLLLASGLAALGAFTWRRW